MTDKKLYPESTITHRRDDADDPPHLVNHRNDSFPRSTVSPWRASDFTPLVTGSGAIKLAASAVAPLVAAARGYETVQDDQAKNFAKRWMIGDGRSKRGSQFLSSFRDDGDALVMPWYSVDQQKLNNADLSKESTRNIQLRPQNPRIENGKSVKYEFLVGSDTVLDFHPALTRSWTGTASRTMIAEGLLKADSALTAQLRAHVNEGELYITAADQDRSRALMRLAQLADRIPAHERVAILAIAGVGNWRQNTEWAGVDLREKEVLIAFDGDVASNFNVWTQASQLMHFVEKTKRGTPFIVDLAKHTHYESAAAAVKGFGLDDLLASVGSWDDIDGLLDDTLPERPPRPDDDRVGEWRVAKDGLSTEECVAVTDAAGNSIGVKWDRRVPLGGAIASTQTRRVPTKEEDETGTFGAGIIEEQFSSDCVIEVRWLDPTSDREVAVNVFGPAKIAAMDPRDWDRAGAKIPPRLLYHPEWPPKRAMDWMKAVKSNDNVQMQDLTTWAVTGWVPIPGEPVPAFIVGPTIIAPTEESAKLVRPGVTEEHLVLSSNFGLADVYTADGFTDPKGEHSLRDDLGELIETWVTNSPWESKRIAVTLLAAALRPVVPLANGVIIYIEGTAGTGKSWAARQLLTFWQRKAGAWERRLPGAADDTFASAEHAVSLMPIWVADDLAPKSDQKDANRQESQLETLIRNVFNGGGKRRMHSAGGAREVSNPRSLLVITAENESSVQSIRERVVNISLRKKGENHEPAHRLGADSLVASRIAAALVRWHQKLPQLADVDYIESWAEVVESARAQRHHGAAMATEVLKEIGVSSSAVGRPAEIAADLTLGLVSLAGLLTHLGLTDLADEIHWEEGGWMRLVTEQIGLGHLDKAEHAPGKILMEGLRGVLRAGKGHIVSESGAMPFVRETDARKLNSALGWRNDGFERETPVGDKIGTLIIRNGKRMVLIDPGAAFGVVQKAYPDRLKYGAKVGSTWKDWWTHGFNSKNWDSPGKDGYRVSVRGIGDVVPIDVETVLDVDVEEIPSEVDNREAGFVVSPKLK